MEVNKKELERLYKNKTNDELQELYSTGTLTKLASNILENEMLLREMKIPERVLKKEDEDISGEQKSQQATDVGWEIKTDKNETKQYSDDKTIVEQLISGEIQPHYECRRLQKKSENIKESENIWLKVSDSLAKSDFKFRVLFEPIWAHTIKGASLGIMLGILIWLGSGIFIFSAYDKRLGAVVVYSIFFYMFLGDFVPSEFKKAVGVLLFVLVTMLARNGYAFTFEDISFGFMAQLGSLFGGIIAGVFPGMIVGTLMGFYRQGGLVKSPHHISENYLQIAIKGIVIPLALFLSLVALYVTYEPILLDLIQKR